MRALQIYETNTMHVKDYLNNYSCFFFVRQIYYFAKVMIKLEMRYLKIF